MTAPVVIRPADGKRILVSSNIKPASIEYLLRGTRLSRTHCEITPAGTWLPHGRLAQVVDALAEDRGRCEVVLLYKDDEFCTPSCQMASETTDMECVCCCGGVFHMMFTTTGSFHGTVIKGQEDGGPGLIRVSNPTPLRQLTVHRGQGFRDRLSEVLAAEFAAVRAPGVQANHPLLHMAERNA